MREITLHSSLTGLGRFVSIRDKIKTSQIVEEGSYEAGSSSTVSTSLEDIFTAFGETLPPLIDEAYVNAYTTWLGSSKINWALALGTKGFAQAVSSWKKSVVPLVEDVESTGYVETLIKGRKILELLVGARVNETRVRSLIDSGAPLSSFLPESGSICEPVKYDHSSKTGRLKVVSGPKVLTLSKEHRNIFESRYPGGKIITVDFVSLEPRVALLAVGQKPMGDVYEEISKKTGSSRAKTKLATLSFLFGAGAGNSGGGDVRLKVREHFRVNKLNEIILSCNGSNAYGRPLHIEDEHHQISHWVQSSAVDVCLLGFSDLMNRIGSLADPLFLVHDALFIDVPSDNLQKVSDIIAEGVNVSPFGYFPFSLNQMS